MTINLTNDTFKEKVFEYDTEKDWKFKGDKPAIVDFWAEWCGPCRMVGPVLEEIGKDYEGKIDIYKVDVDSNPELSQAFGIQSIPAILFIPIEGQPQMSLGALPKATIEKAIEEVLKVKKDEE
jgi:thioredoxin